MKVVIASKNPVKINAVKEGFSKMFNKEFSFESIDVTAPDQPLTDKDTLEGAKNRALQAKKKVDADFYIGVEGGLEKIDDEYHAFTWVYIIHKDKSGKAKTATFMLPKSHNDYIEKGKELGDVDDILFNRKNSKQGDGAVSILTNDIITRTSYTAEAVVLALIPFSRKDF